MLIYVGAFLLIPIAVIMYIYVTGRQEKTRKAVAFFGNPIDRQSLLIVLLALLFAIGIYFFEYYYVQQSFLRSFMDASIIIWLAVLGYIDFKEKIIPNKMILVGIVFWGVLFLLEVFVAQTSWKEILVYSGTGAVVCGGILLLVATVAKSALGMGDVKLFFVLGLLYGAVDTYSILLFSVFAMAIVSVALLIAKKVTIKTAVPMAPFVFVGFIINIFLGN